jgi:murein DD-endopeptidase MepM/ murein hydrolase activator NlpD
MSDNKLVQVLWSNQILFAPIVPFDPSKDTLLSLDFTAGNTELTDEILEDTRLFCDYINAKLGHANARYGIGGYGEHRTVYSKSSIFDGSPGENEPRRLHIGIDIWGRPHTAIMAPLDGIVHSFAFNDRKGDYGATIILSHQLEGISFHTLYGHLSLNSIRNLREGDRIRRSDIFAEFGIPNENGHWPPHLHFQLINDLEGWTGDYPGVCKYSEKEKYLNNCPDPELVLQLDKYVKGKERSI